MCKVERWGLRVPDKRMESFIEISSNFLGGRLHRRESAQSPRTKKVRESPNQYRSPRVSDTETERCARS